MMPPHTRTQAHAHVPAHPHARTRTRTHCGWMIVRAKRVRGDTEVRKVWKSPIFMVFFSRDL
jgi:hypothetical protein